MADVYYEVIYEPWWASNGCDCCEPTEMPSYYIRHLDGELLTDYKFQSLEDAYKAILEKHRIDVEVIYGDEE